MLLLSRHGSDIDWLQSDSVWTRENAERDHAANNNNTFTHCKNQISPSATPTPTLTTLTPPVTTTQVTSDSPGVTTSDPTSTSTPRTTGDGPTTTQDPRPLSTVSGAQLSSMVTPNPSAPALSGVQTSTSPVAVSRSGLKSAHLWCNS